MLHASANRRSLAVILVCAFATGCVHRPVYWESWAKQVIVEPGACPVIDGDYQNAGERFLKAKHHTYERQNVSLAHLLNGWVSAKRFPAHDRLGRTAFNPAEDPYQSISLRLAEGKLHIRASRADDSTQAFDLPTRQQCRDSILLLEKGWGDSGTGLYFSLVERSALGLGRAEDGSLLVRHSASGVGFVMLLPVSVDTEAFWFRFPPVAPSPADAESPPASSLPARASYSSRSVGAFTILSTFAIGIPTVPPPTSTTTCVAVWSTMRPEIEPAPLMNTSSAKRSVGRRNRKSGGFLMGPSLHKPERGHSMRQLPQQNGCAHAENFLGAVSARAGLSG
jgi:hypothetical protein